MSAWYTWHQRDMLRATEAYLEIKKENEAAKAKNAATHKKTTEKG